MYSLCKLPYDALDMANALKTMAGPATLGYHPPLPIII